MKTKKCNKCQQYAYLQEEDIFYHTSKKVQAIQEFKKYQEIHKVRKYILIIRIL